MGQKVRLHKFMWMVVPLCLADLAGSGWSLEMPSPEVLLVNAMAYHDPDGRFLSEPHRLQFLETRPDGSEHEREVLIDIPGGRFEMTRGGEREIAGVLDAERCEWTLDGRSDFSESERAKNGLKCERLHFMRDYYTYLWGLPMKLRDPGTRLGPVSAITFEERPVFELRVTYDEAVGQDIWYFYFDRSSYALVGYRFYHDEAKNDGEVIYLEGEVEALGMRLPRQRTWVTHADGRTLGTDTLLAVNGS